jgi:hypothetical protein
VAVTGLILVAGEHAGKKGKHDCFGAIGHAAVTAGEAGQLMGNGLGLELFREEDDAFRNPAIVVVFAVVQGDTLELEEIVAVQRELFGNRAKAGVPPLPGRRVWLAAGLGQGVVNIGRRGGGVGGKGDTIGYGEGQIAGRGVGPVEELLMRLGGGESGELILQGKKGVDDERGVSLLV